MNRILLPRRSRLAFHEAVLNSINISSRPSIIGASCAITKAGTRTLLRWRSGEPVPQTLCPIFLISEWVVKFLFELTPRFYIGWVVLTLLMAASAFACGHPIEMMPQKKVSSTQRDWQLSNDFIPENWQLPNGYCLVRNYTDCNSDELFANLRAGLLLFDDTTEFCSDEDKKHLRSLFIEINIFYTFLIVFGCLLLYLAWKKASSWDVKQNGVAKK